MPNNEGEKAKFAYVMGENQELPVSYETDGLTGEVEINKRSFDLSNGWLFLVSTAKGTVDMRQVQREKVKVRTDVEGGNIADFEKLKSDLEVIGFFHASAEDSRAAGSTAQ